MKLLITSCMSEALFISYWCFCFFHPYIHMLPISLLQGVKYTHTLYHWRDANNYHFTWTALGNLCNLFQTLWNAVLVGLFTSPCCHLRPLLLLYLATTWHISDSGERQRNCPRFPMICPIPIPTPTRQWTWAYSLDWPLFSGDSLHFGQARGRFQGPRMTTQNATINHSLVIITVGIHLSNHSLQQLPPMNSSKSV